MLVTRFTDTMPEGPIGEADAPSPAMEAWLRTDVELPPGYVRWTDALAANCVPGPHTAAPDDLALLPYTSGTTGLPKGCMHTHRTLMANSVGGQWSYSSPEALGLGVVPMFHITGMLYSVLGSVYSGATVVLMPRWDRELAGRLISRHRITHWVCIPTMVIDLFGSPNYKSFDLSSLRSMSGGGAAMPHAVAQRLLDEFGITFAEGYGLTETAAPSHANPPERAKLQCLGIPIFSVDSRVVDPLTLEELPLGEVGEIITRGPMVFKGYWRHPEATAEAFVEFDGRSFFRTGDLGRMDEEGYFFMTDRLKRMINASGFKVWPAEVEMLLYKHPAVQEACIIAAQRRLPRRDRQGGGGAARQGQGHARPRTSSPGRASTWPPTRCRKIVQFVDALPKSGSGKVMWRAAAGPGSARRAEVSDAVGLAKPGSGARPVCDLGGRPRCEPDSPALLGVAWPPQNSLRSLRSLRSNMLRQVRPRSACARRSRLLGTSRCLGRLATHAARAPTPACERRVRHVAPGCRQSRGRVPGRARVRRRAAQEPGPARAARLAHLTCRSLSERSERSERSEFCGRPRVPSSAGQSGRAAA